MERCFLSSTTRPPIRCDCSKYGSTCPASRRWSHQTSPWSVDNPPSPAPLSISLSVSLSPSLCLSLSVFVSLTSRSIGMKIFRRFLPPMARLRSQHPISPPDQHPSSCDSSLSGLEPSTDTQASLLLRIPTALIRALILAFISSKFLPADSSTFLPHSSLTPIGWSILLKDHHSLSME
jgi:hypothetical protein